MLIAFSPKCGSPACADLPVVIISTQSTPLSSIIMLLLVGAPSNSMSGEIAFFSLRNAVPFELRLSSSVTKVNVTCPFTGPPFLAIFLATQSCTTPLPLQLAAPNP